MGTIYKRGTVYWIKYHRSGKPYYESSKSGKEAVAKKLLKKREGEIADGKLPGIYFDKITYDELAADLITDYEINDKKSTDRIRLSIKHLDETFKGILAVNLSSARLKEYIDTRQEQGATNATINRELAALKRMFHLGARCAPPKVSIVPFIPRLKENNVRKGFFEHGDFLALREKLPEHLRGLVTFGYKTGWRLSEITGLTWSQVDMGQGIVRLNPGETKNDEGRTVYVDKELRAVLEGQLQTRRKEGKVLPHVFPNEDGTDRVKRFDKSWKTACGQAKIGPRIFHDLRRTAVRNMVRAGVPERVVMMISGHKTRSVFDRYNIVSDSDLRIAAQKQEAYLKAQTVTKTVTVEDFGKKKGAAVNG